MKLWITPLDRTNEYVMIKLLAWRKLMTSVISC